MVWNPSVPHEALSLPIKERLIEVKNCLCDLEPRVRWRLFPEIFFSGFKDPVHLYEDCLADGNLAEEGLDSIGCRSLAVVERSSEVLGLPV